MSPSDIYLCEPYILRLLSVDFMKSVATSIRSSNNLINMCKSDYYLGTQCYMLEISNTYICLLLFINNEILIWSSNVTSQLKIKRSGEFLLFL